MKIKDRAHFNLDFKMAGSKDYMTKEEFEQMVMINKENDKILTWLELDGDIVYNITRIEERFSKKFNGPCWILHLIKKEGEEPFKVWSPKKLVEDIKTRRRTTERVFIMSLGQEYYKGRTFNKYDLVFKDSNEVINIFDGEEQEDRDQ